MKIPHLVLGLFLSILGGSIANSQVSFNNYTPLVSQGKIPSDFYVKTSDKIESDLQQRETDLNSTDLKIFLREIHFGVDQLLQSGVVVFGDEVSKYVESVGKRLLKAAKVKEDIRFYTIKSNVSNAFSTDQGIIFITTGLISQLVNEAQLALILGHEISHFTEHHVVETFEYKNTRNLRNQIVQLATYSKDKEFEADLLGLELYHKAGYTKDAVRGTFDVLMYSYLPFDEIAFPKDYFKSDLCFVPEELYPGERFEIKAEENYDDSKSSHPNIQRRKEKIMAKANELSNWGDVTYFEGEERFKYIRNICRFESVRNDLLNASYGKALYSIFLLEREFPESIFLNRMKAQAWLGISGFKLAGSIYETINSRSDLEGESAALHYFLRELSTKEMVVLALRQIEDIRKKYPEDEEIKIIWGRMIKTFNSTKGLDFTDFKEKSFTVYTQEFEQKLKELEASKNLVPDSSNVTTKQDEELSKYDRIKRKKSDNPTSETDQIDSTKYYLYNLSDLTSSELFLAKLSEIKDAEKAKEDEKKRIDNMSSREYRKYVNEGNLDPAKIDLSNFVLVEPIAISYGRRGIKVEESEALQERYSEAALIAIEELGVNAIYVDKSVFKTIGTDGYNQKAIYTSLLIQLNNSVESQTFPVDYSLLRDLQAKNNTSKVVFTIVENNYRVDGLGILLTGILLPPILPALLVNKIIKGNNTEVSLIVMDIEKGEIENGASYYFNEPTNKYLLSGRFYNMIYDLMQH
ncbi:MAG: M48 family metalloprotease [Crocinitomicaceae bacterium]|jgi:predicted Zn-dependent protease|nr:M48 family metalloprotease [Crocinitomicaceae bacterium]